VPLRELDADGIDDAVVMIQSGTVDKPSVMLGAALATVH